MSMPPYKIVERELLEYFAAVAADGRPGVTLGKGTGEEVFVPVELLPTLDEWRQDPELRAWEARVPPYVVEVWRRVRAAQDQQVEETMSMFDEDEAGRP
jgi:hypothetical protein